MESQCWVWTAAHIRKPPEGHGTFRINGRLVLAHRVSYEWHKGPIPHGLMIDHRCRNRSCVNPDHLRIATSKQNNENRRGANSNSASGMRGVWWDKNTNGWRAEVWHNRQKHYAGFFRTKEEAEVAAIKKRNELFTYNDADREGFDSPPTRVRRLG